MTGADRLRAEGLEQGLEQGREQGRVETARRLLDRLLQLKFGPVPPRVTPLLDAAAADQLEAWAEGVLVADSLDALFPR